jgi:TonB family protein
MIRRLFIVTFIITATVFTALAQPAFKGGQQALMGFLKAKIVYPEYSSQNCISAVIDVAFRLDKNGRVVNAKVQRGLGIDLDDEALRVIKLTSGQWIIPADYNENTILVQPIRFDPEQTRCRSSNNNDMQAAIANYQARQELENAVTNYYINKYKGTADTTRESNIITLKKQLGFDDDLISDLLKQANTKLKQGDKDGACTDWNFIRNIGSNKADVFIAKYCKP